jgi:predicted amidohydrolase
MPTQEITVATVQMEPELGRMEENLVKMREFIDRVATEQPVDLIVFPELITTGYELGPRFPQLAQRVPGAAVNLIAQRASDLGIHVAFGMATKKEKVESVLYNTAIMVGPDGDVLHQHHKIHLQGEEQITFRSGYQIRECETALGSDGLTVGMLVGWDLAFPETARSLVMRGAELLVVLANWEEPHADEWRVYLRARAYENAVFVAAANRVGEEPSYTFFGQSAIVDPYGQFYATVEDPAEGYAVTTIDLNRMRQRRDETQILQCRHPETYRDVTRKY